MTKTFADSLPARGITKLYKAEFRAWWDMKDRCSNPDNKFYHRYGGRGIRVSKRWSHSFREFLIDMGPRLSAKHSLDRINNNGHYRKKNCRWATSTQQNQNYARNKLYAFQGETLCVTEWARRFNLEPACVYTRLKRGWSIEEALTFQPWGLRKGSTRMATINGKTQSLRRWAAEIGVRPDLVYERIERGWSAESAILTPPRIFKKKQ